LAILKRSIVSFLFENHFKTMTLFCFSSNFVGVDREVSPL
jgi:hypothetical protein